jgi:hypothetical protein
MTYLFFPEKNTAQLKVLANADTIGKINIFLLNSTVC